MHPFFRLELLLGKEEEDKEKGKQVFLMCLFRSRLLVYLIKSLLPYQGRPSTLRRTVPLWNPKYLINFISTIGIRVTFTASVYVLPLQPNKQNIFTKFRPAGVVCVCVCGGGGGLNLVVFLAIMTS